VGLTRRSRPPPGWPRAPSLAARLPVHLDALARIAREHDGNRAAGTSGGAASEAYVERTLRDAGFAVRRQRVRFDQFVERRPPTLRRPGRRFRAPSEVRTLEFSASGNGRGGLNDNGSGTAAVLALAERLAAEPAPARDAGLRVAF